MRIFDTHAHYDSGAFNADWKELLASMPQKGVELIVNPGCDLESSRTAIALAEQFPFVYAAVGVHPSDCGDWEDGWLVNGRWHDLHYAREDGAPMVNYTWVDYMPHATMTEMSFRIWKEFFSKFSRDGKKVLYNAVQ